MGAEGQWGHPLKNVMLGGIESRWCHAGSGQYPSLKDWETHLTTIFPEVRLKRYMEMRGADGGPWDSICALPALWVGLLYTR